MFDREGEMAGEIGGRSVAWRIEAPAVLLILLMTRADGGQGARQRDAEMKRVDERGLTDRRRRFRQPSVVENQPDPKIRA